MYENNPENQPVIGTENIENQPEQEVQAASEQQIVQDRQERNFRELREKQKQLERERDEANRRALYAEALLSKNNQPQHTPEPSLADDDIPEWGQVRKEIDKIQQQLADERKKVELSNAELRLASMYPDYRELLSDKNIDLLRTIEPELMSSIDSNPDMYSKAVAAIKAVKTFGIQNRDEYGAKKEAIKQQAAKPKSINSLSPSASNSPLNQAHNFTGSMDDAERQRVYEEAVRRSRGW